MSQIFIEGLEVFGHHGVYEEEKQNGQLFIVDCIMQVDYAKASATDALEHTVNYAEVALFIGDYFKSTRHDLLETVAEELATSILLMFPAISELKLKINKPNAPIPMEFAGVGVSLTKGWTKVAIALGSNMGDSQAYLKGAIDAIEANELIRGLTVSDFMETTPYGYVDQDNFLNAAATFETILSPEALLEFLHSLEAEANRQREIHWGPRTLDLDIILYEQEVIDRPQLTIPHMDMANRSFVLDPLNQIAPGMLHPVLSRTVRQLWEELHHEW